MGGGAWWAAVHGVAQSRTRLKRLSSSSSSIHILTSNGVSKYHCYFHRRNLLPSCSILVLKDKPLTDTSRPRSSLNGSSLLSKMRNSFLIITIETPTIASIEKKKWKQNRNTVPPALPLKLRKSCSSIKTHQPVSTMFLPLWKQDFSLPLLTVTAAAVALALTVWNKHVATWEPDVGHCHWEARLEVVQCFSLYRLSCTLQATMSNGTCTGKRSPENRIELRPQTGYEEKFKDTY